MATWNKPNLLGHKSLMNQATTNLGVKTPKMPNIEREIKIKQPRFLVRRWMWKSCY